MIDIHCHMLPGVDDGSDSMDTSLLMASMAAESGVETVIVTPHCNIPGEAANYPSRELLGRFMALRETIDAAKIPLRILAVLHGGYRGAYPREKAADACEQPLYTGGVCVQ